MDRAGAARDPGQGQEDADPGPDQGGGRDQGQGGGLDQGAGRGQDVALDQGVDPDPDVAQGQARDAE
mgnify:CR=1 FL=1